MAKTTKVSKSNENHGTQRVEKIMKSNWRCLLVSSGKEIILFIEFCMVLCFVVLTKPVLITQGCFRKGSIYDNIYYKKESGTDFIHVTFMGTAVLILAVINLVFTKLLWVCFVFVTKIELILRGYFSYR